MWFMNHNNHEEENEVNLPNMDLDLLPPEFMTFRDDKAEMYTTIVPQIAGALHNNGIIWDDNDNGAAAAGEEAKEVGEDEDDDDTEEEDEEIVAVERRSK